MKINNVGLSNLLFLPAGKRYNCLENNSPVGLHSQFLQVVIRNCFELLGWKLSHVVFRNLS